MKIFILAFSFCIFSNSYGVEYNDRFNLPKSGDWEKYTIEEAKAHAEKIYGDLQKSVCLAHRDCGSTEDYKEIENEKKQFLITEASLIKKIKDFKSKYSGTKEKADWKKLSPLLHAARVDESLRYLDSECQETQNEATCFRLMDTSKYIDRKWGSRDKFIDASAEHILDNEDFLEEFNKLEGQINSKSCKWKPNATRRSIKGADCGENKNSDICVGFTICELNNGTKVQRLTTCSAKFCGIRDGNACAKEKGYTSKNYTPTTQSSKKPAAPKARKE